MNRVTYTTLTREAVLLLGALAYLAERTTEPDRVERIINRAYIRWHRRSTERAQSQPYVDYILSVTKQGYSIPSVPYMPSCYLVEALAVAKSQRLAAHGMAAWRLLAAITVLETELQKRADA